MDTTHAVGMQKGIWRGWYWRFDALLVVAIAVLECIAFYVSKGRYSFVASGELGMFVAVLVVVQRAKVMRRWNAVAVAIVSYLIDVVFQLTLGRSDTMYIVKHHETTSLIVQNVVILAIGVLFAFVYAWSTEMSDRRRAKAEAERAAKRSQEREVDELPRVRVHRVKKRRGRGKRPKS
ncbi:hypothetical protein C7445_1055 [Alicyclobacillus sacchari]|uniref:Uncharacterized protein n=1 Tax=Alicyclobacillus sacchari TaxID=392010 RepID=A0A4R8LNI6_9BACL|nr:hypothetical protein [Alicyclobacillus sacchari]TDY47832.1 hypothetical protein C7445_1055 [Alicyclobacillus sacchari]GMA55913.1 hypothetical protein GCM10025858_04160 [Alicyclobacillus sacchari]